MKSKIGQQLIIGIQGTTLSNDEVKLIGERNLGGVILFKRNCESPDQIRELTQEIQSLQAATSDRLPFFISIDMEGGRVSRLKPPFTQWPAVAHLGKIDSTSVAFKFAQSMGAELHSVGINLNFAPCIDVLSNPQNQVIGDRALSTKPEVVAKLGSALVRGYIKSHVLPCAKHFPGHGNTLLDSHEDLPVEEKNLADLEALEFEPFKKVIRARLDMLMVAHILYPNIDAEWPASLSEIFLRKILRDQLRYRNLVITDDLDMKALTRHHSKATIAVRAIKAGANILLYCNEPESPLIALEAIEKALADGEINRSMIEENHRKIVDLKKKTLSTLGDQTPNSNIIFPSHENIRLAEAIVAGSVPADLLSQAE